MSKRHCSYCLRDTHNRDNCPHEARDKLRPEWERLTRLCQKDADAMRYGIPFDDKVKA